MSNLARTPESYAAWQRIKRSQALPHHEQPWVMLEKTSMELDLLGADMEESPTLEKIENFLKRGLELSEMTEQSLAQSFQSARDQELCKADIRAAKEVNRRLEAENLQLIEYVRKKAIVVAQKRALLERMQQQYAENERLIVSLGIPFRRDIYVESPLDVSSPFAPITV
ncbi:hypothetical protein EDB92DRAFT_1817065 [Lactarius akahatsu]|uniref:Uncharacterized protein n=1 Tax=Lactarius akahatsu TaxID=416441 RepID=A0AAD4LFD9_9AGAM|nr:hypothetical protein EDB92DRAFT_1817065 [Lactarius akahatsu]